MHCSDGITHLCQDREIFRDPDDHTIRSARSCGISGAQDGRTATESSKGIRIPSTETKRPAHRCVGRETPCCARRRSGLQFRCEKPDHQSENTEISCRKNSYMPPLAGDDGFPTRGRKARNGKSAGVSGRNAPLRHIWCPRPESNQGLMLTRQLHDLHATGANRGGL